MRRVLAALALLVAVDPAPAHAWGRDGHQIVAVVAQSLLTPRARTQADALLAVAGGESFVAASDWADRIRRGRPETAAWHFVDVQIGAGPYDEARDCPRRACAVAKIEDFRTDLADARLDPERRGEALKWLIHLVGDVHQPLHAADRRDRGGNGLEVLVDDGPQPGSGRGPKETNLHRLWDVDLVSMAGRGATAAEHAATLTRSIGQADRAAWSRGSAADWANEAHGIAERIAYGELPPGPRPTITAEYERDATQAVDLQLKRAGVRLAAILNASLDPNGVR